MMIFSTFALFTNVGLLWTGVLHARGRRKDIDMLHVMLLLECHKFSPNNEL